MLIQTRYLDEKSKWRPFEGGTRGPELSMTAHWTNDGASREMIAARWAAMRAGVPILVEGVAVGYLVRIVEV